jgi:hypothetical protein
MRASLTLATVATYRLFPQGPSTARKLRLEKTAERSLVIALLLLQSCAAPAAPQLHSQATTAHLRPVTPNTRLQGLVAIPWQRARTLEGGHRLRIFFYGGASRCGGLKKVAVHESARSVVVTLFQGHVPGSTYCPITTAQEKRVNVHLRHALGTRKLKDGGRVSTS